jgi:N-acetylated-alpha-linked acidic dipeptidase
VDGRELRGLDKLKSCGLATLKWSLVVSALAALTGASPQARQSPASSLHPPAAEAEIETAFRSTPTPRQARDDLQVLTRVPHVAGTHADYQTAQYVLSQFRQAGLEAQIVEYDVLLPMPEEVKVELVSRERRNYPSPELGWKAGADGKTRAVPPFNAFSPSGDVTAPVVYANYGLPGDYRALEQKGIDVRGKVVMARYGKCFRGVKDYVAERHHAAALVLYSDPADDGYARGDTYPRGPWRPPDAVQRGSILPMVDYAGDPLTPGIAATPQAPRLRLSQAPLPKIPVTSLAYQDARRILQDLSGPAVPTGWQGALPFTYHCGPGDSVLHIKLRMDYRVRPVWDVIATLQGARHPGDWVILGNHRDAWGYGAADPGSGTVALLAVGRGLGYLLARGWKPTRTMVLASWDAEEFGIMGSTEWAEDHAAFLSRHAVAYLNVDVGVSGPHFGAAAVPSLDRLIRDVAREVSDPKTGRSVLDAWRQEKREAPRRHAGSAESSEPPAARAAPADVQVGDLGSGSDYAAFLDHLGVPSLDVSFTGPYGVYHSSYDSFAWMEKFGDPSFRYSVAEAQIYGTLALRLADSAVLPFDYQDYGLAIQKYLRDLQADTAGSVPPGENLPLQAAEQAARKFTETAAALDQRLAALDEDAWPESSTLDQVNQELLEVERNFLLDKGLPGRPWFRHAFFAPGVYTGYKAVVLPGVREAVDRKDWAVARRQLDLVRESIERATVTLEAARKAPARQAAAGAPAKAD